MGLLDALFSPDSYGGQGGGLLDLIRSTQAQNSQYQPGMGFADNQPSPLDNAQWPAGPGGAPSAPATFADRFSAMPGAPGAFNPAPRQMDASNFDPQTFAPNQAQPIQVGNNYQMPRIGGADQFQPQQAMLPPNAQPAQGQMPTDVSSQGRQPQQPQELPPAFGGSSYLERVNAGGGIIGSMLGDTTQQKNLTAQYHALRQALISNGETPQAAASKAMIATMNPEAAKTIIPELFTNKQKFGVISKDPLEGEKYGFINERDQTINDKPIGASGSPQATTGLQGLTDKITSLRSSGATKEQMLNEIPTGYRDDVKSLIAGKSVPANMGRAQSRMALLTLAKVVDPNFDEQMIPTRIAMRKDFAGEGKNGQAIGSFNTVQHHAGQVSDAIEEFQKAGGGSDYPLWNAGKLMLANNTGANPKLRDAAQKLQDKLNATEHEVASAYNSGHVSDSDRKTWNEIKASNMPADQLKQKLADFVDLLNGKRDSLNHMYRQTFGEDAPTVDKESNLAITKMIQQRLPEHAKNIEQNAGGVDRSAIEAEMKRRGLLK